MKLGIGMRALSCGLAAAAGFAVSAHAASLKPTHETCGWAVGDTELVLQPDPALSPLAKALPAAAPPNAKAAYCIRDSIVTQVGDEQVLKRYGLPLLIREGDREAVLEYDPSILFDYHREGDRYLPGARMNGPTITARAKQN